MWFSFITVFGLFVFSHGYSNEKSNDGGNVEIQLDSLQARIDTLTGRQDAQELRINTLIENSASNRAFQYDYEDVAREDISNEIKTQDQRLERLARKVAQIQGLKANVGKLQQQAAEIRNVVNQTNTRDINTQSSVNEGEYPDVEEINANAVAAVRIQQGLEVIVKQLENNSRTLNVLEFRTAQIITTQEFNTVESSYHKLPLKSGTASLDVQYPGFAREVGVFVNGFNLAGTGGNNTGTPSVEFKVTVDFVDTIRVNAYDLSANGWSTKALYVVVIGNTLQEKRLDIRYPFSV